MQNRIRVSNMKKVAVAAIAASALVLASCSDSGDSGNTASGGTSAASSDKSASSKGSSGGASTSASGAAASGAATSSGEAKPAEGASSDAPPLPENVTPPALPTTTHQPVEGGQPASPEDAITAETTLRSYMGYIPQHTCKKVLDENGGEKSLDLGQIPDVPLDSYPDFKKAKPTIDSVTDIKVAGETASAQVTASTEADGQTVATQRFAKENGKWVFCN